MNTTVRPQPTHSRLRRSSFLPLTAAIGLAVLAGVVHTQLDWSDSTPAAPTAAFEMSLPAQELPPTVAEIIEHDIAVHSGSFPWPLPPSIRSQSPATLEETLAVHEALIGVWLGAS